MQRGREKEVKRESEGVIIITRMEVERVCVSVRGGERK
jgi:hypothetical protein